MPSWARSWPDTGEIRIVKGEAPASIIAQGRAFPGKTQPLCPYPQVATYRGEGDENSAESFSCQ